MKRALAIFLCFFVASQAFAGQESSNDLFLRRIIQAYGLLPLPTKPYEEIEKFELGRVLFFDPILSGNRDVSCATCHLIGRGTSDALAFSIGSGGIGLGENRTLPPERIQQPRNALDLWNRDNNSVKTMFWDGRVEVVDPVRKTFRSPLAEQLPKGFENLMAVQAVFPLVREDELLGMPGDHSPLHLPEPHANRINELASRTAGLRGKGRIKSVLKLVMERLLGRAGEQEQPWHAVYRNMFRAAYPDVETKNLSIVHVGNAVAHFEEIAFATRKTPWDIYLKGDLSAISTTAKRGAILFFGKARCAVCHSGPLFSDFKFHSIGVRDHGPGFDSAGSDLGRYAVTSNPSEKYKFRTPPLRNVTLTKPYFHNGSAATLQEAIRQHLDPLFYADKYDESGAFTMNLDQIQAVSPILTTKIGLSDSAVEELISFFRALEDRDLTKLARIVPTSVPSGLPVSSIEAISTGMRH